MLLQALWSWSHVTKITGIWFQGTSHFLCCLTAMPMQLCSHIPHRQNFLPSCLTTLCSLICFGSNGIITLITGVTNTFVEHQLHTFNKIWRKASGDIDHIYLILTPCFAVLCLEKVAFSLSLEFTPSHGYLIFLCWIWVSVLRMDLLAVVYGHSSHWTWFRCCVGIYVLFEKDRFKRLYSQSSAHDKSLLLMHTCMCVL